MKQLTWPLCSFVMLSVSSLVMAGESEHSHKHKHSQLEVSSQSEKPSVSLQVTRDVIGGWNLHLTVMNFRFAPEHVNGRPVQGEGHAHLYVDGKKVARLYGPWFHLGDLPLGRHSLQVTLNANNHAGLVLNGEPIAATEEINQE
jgi:hypothetical protein